MTLRLGSGQAFQVRLLRFTRNDDLLSLLLGVFIFLVYELRTLNYELTER